MGRGMPRRYKKQINIRPSGQGEEAQAFQFPIGGENPREQQMCMIRCNSLVDGIVRIKEGK